MEDNLASGGNIVDPYLQEVYDHPQFIVDRDAQTLKRDVYQARLEAEANLMAQGVFRARHERRPSSAR